MYRLLIADDEQLERDALRYIVQRGSLEVSEIVYASNGREAVALAAEWSPDIAFLDIKMPGVNGIEAARRIKQLLPGIHIVFLTAFDYFDYAHEAIRIGVDDFLVKPASDARVMEVISRIAEELGRERTRKLRNEKRDQKLEQITSMLSARIEESLSRGFVDSESLVELFSLLELDFASAVVVQGRLSFERYPMRIESEGQEMILRKRCLQALRAALSGRHMQVFGAVVPAGITVLVSSADPGFASDGAGTLCTLLADTSARIATELSLTLTVGISTVRRDTGRLDELVEEAGVALLSGTPDASGRVRKAPRAEVSPALSSLPPALPPEQLEQRLVRSIVAADVNAADRAIDDLLGRLRARCAGWEPFRCAVGETMVVVRHAVARQIPGWEYAGDTLAEELSRAEEESAVRALTRSAARRMIRSSERVASRAVPPAVQRTAAFIDQHYAQEMSLEQLAGLAGQSVSHLSRVFKQHTGMAPVEYITAVRIRRSKELLVHPTLSIKEISVRCGYTDPTYFTRVFRRAEGMSPSEYRERQAGRAAAGSS
ncbi:helix-turn-helix domain-containing protein [Salinispira pacifica]